VQLHRNTQLLDSSDEYELTECSIYLARWGKLLTWNLDELIGQMSEGRFDYREFRTVHHDWLLTLKSRREEKERIDLQIRELMKNELEELSAIWTQFNEAQYSGDRQLATDAYRRVQMKLEDNKKTEEELRARLRESSKAKE
jgi:hypothetical protein